MKKSQRGIVELAAMVTSTIAVLVLSTVVFISAYDGPSVGSQQTIVRAGFSGFVTDIDSVRIAFITENITQLMGEKIAENNAISEAQAYNYLAKGATTSIVSEEASEHTWMSRGQAGAIPCTRIEKETALEAIGIELPERTVNTWGKTGVEMSYFVTNKGDVFVWPPYYKSDEGLFYVNDRIVVTTPDKNIISGDDEKLMYEDGFEFDVYGVTIKVSNKTENVDNILNSDITREELINMPSIYYKDGVSTEAPEGIESKFMYTDYLYQSQIVGADND